MHTTLSVRLFAAASGCLLLAGASIAGTANAQVPDSRWMPWLGCWTSSDTRVTGITTGGSTSGVVCVVPASSGPGVVVATIANGMVVHSERMNATGAHTPKTLENCPGWESATWSADGHRLLLRSEFVCDRNLTVKGSGIFAISGDGEWLQVQGSTVGRNASAYVVRYHAAGLELANTAAAGQLNDSTPARLVVTTGTGLATRSARFAAGEPVRPDAVLEVTQQIEGPVAEAWVNEIGQRFTVEGKELVRLADAGMPSKMIDLLVALSYPDRFVLQRNAIVSTPRLGGGSGSGAGVGSVYTGAYDRRWDCGYGNRMLAYGYYGDSCYPGYYGLSGYGYGGYGYGAYGYGGYPYNGYGYGSYGNGYYGGQQPIIIVPRNPEGDQHGRAVNGAGYTRGSSTPARTGNTAPDRTPSSSSGSSAGSSGSSGSSTPSSTPSSAPSSSGSSSEPRTAQPRVPPG